jgi:iron complex outermembrane receptor protein
MRRIIIAMLCTALASAVAAADGQEGPYRLNEIIVTASRTDTALREAGGNVTVITQDDIEEAGAQTIPELFNREPGLFPFNMSGTPQTAKVDIRGYGEAAPQNALFLIDGRRVNNIDWTGADLSQIPLDAIERIEIYRGPASVLYGDNAAAGVVNIILKKGRGKPVVRVMAGAGSDQSSQGSLSSSGTIQDFSYFLHSSLGESDGYRRNNTTQTKDALGSFSIGVLKNLQVSLKAGHHRDSYGLPGALYWKGDLNSGLYDRKDTRNPFDNASTEDNFADMEVNARLAESINLSLGGSYRVRHGNSHYQGTGWFNDWKSVLDTYSLTPKLTCMIPLWGRKSTFTAGLDYYRYPSSSDSFGGAWVHNEGSIRKTDTAFYMNEKLFLIPQLSLEGGYRRQAGRYEFDYTDYVFAGNSYKGRTTETEEAYRGTVNYTFHKKGNLYFSYAKGFRFPVTDEFVGIDPTTFAPFFNPNVKPQTTEEMDLGLRWNPHPRVGGTVTLFKTINHDEIYFNPKFRQVWGFWLGANENYERTTRTGVEATILLQPAKGLSLDLSYSYLEAKFDGGPFDGNLIPLVPRNKLGAKVTYRLHCNKSDIVFTLAMQSIGARYAVSDQLNTERTLPGYATFDLSVLYTVRKFNVLFATKNLTGKKYYEYGTYSPNRNDIGVYPAPERQFFAKVSYDL